jgi:hypothetical protein
MKAIENRGRTIDGVVNPRNYPPFSKIPDRTAFDAAWINRPDWIFANMAHAAYCDQSYLEELFDSFGARIKFYQSKADRHGIVRGREAYLAIWEEKAILSFRGTEADDKLELKLRENEKISRLTGVSFPSKFKISFIPTDIVDDLNFSPVTYKGKNGRSQVHRGFFKSTEELWPEISGDLDKLELSSPDQLFVTGHSLGAAMAVIAGVKYPFNKIVTFGEPSVGNDLDNTIDPDCLHIRYVNGIDPVTKIVPDSLYEHHGKLKEIEDIDGPDVRFDHSIINYATILETW